MFQATHLSVPDMLLGAQFLVAVTVFTTVVLVDKLYARPPGRAELIARFQHSRFRKMLTLRGLDTTAYLQTASTVGLDRRLEVCSGCLHKTFCDTVLREGGAASYAFCPNERAIEEKVIERLQQSPAHAETALLS